MIDSWKSGATASYRSMTRSAYASSSAAWGSSLQSAGTHWVNSEKMCVPSGFSVRSSVVGITPSQNGATAGRPSRASMKARSMYSIVGAISTDPVWCSACPSLGSAVKLRQLGRGRG